MKNLFSIPLFLAAFVVLAFSGCRPADDKAGLPPQPGEDAKRVIRSALEFLKEPVTLDLYRGDTGETAYRETRAILEFMADTAPKIQMREYALDPGDEGPGAGPLPDTNHGPVVRMEGVNRGSLFFYGIPERRELQPFLDGVLMASGRPADLPSMAESFLSKLDQDIQIRIFTTPDCSFCPEPVRLAYAFAVRSSRVTARIFASHQFPDEARAFEVVTVPKIWVNDKIYVDGAAPSRDMMIMTLMAMIGQALDESAPPGRLRINAAD